MNIKLVIGLGGVASAAIFIGQLSATTAGGGEPAAPLGPDVIVGDLPAVHHWGNLGTIHSYSIGTTSCNIGDEDLIWQSNNNRHPVVAQTMYRLSSGRLEQIGQSWLKHTFVTINNGICGQCNGHLGSVLGVGCSDPYSSTRNGGQARLGPKSDINAYNGVYPYPYGICWQCTGNDIYKRLQVQLSDIQNTGDLYFVEGHYVTQDDAQYFQGGVSNGVNNASYRRITFNATYNVTVQNTTQRQKPAIYAWKDHGLGANQPDPAVTITVVDIPNEGRLFLASKVTDNQNGTWRYDYAIQNLNSDRSGRSFTVPMESGTTITAPYFRDVVYHSGEPWNGNDWAITVGPNSVNWTTESFTDDANANALRWNTMYTFSFTADAPPESGEVTIGLFKPGTPDSVTVTAPVPQDSSETICPESPDDYFRQYGGNVTGDASALCLSDNAYLSVRQIAGFTPALPLIRLETWAFSSLDAAVSQVQYFMEGRVSANVAGGQNPDTMRTSIKNYATGLFEVVDQRATLPGTDELVVHTQSVNANDYVNAGDGEVRIRVEAWEPGVVVSPNWSLYVDLYEASLTP